MTEKLNPADYESRSLGSLELELRRQMRNGRDRTATENMEMLGRLIGKQQTEAIMSVIEATGESLSESRSTLIHHGWDTTKAIRHIKRSKTPLNTALAGGR
jgi:hypothetical protein